MGVSGIGIASQLLNFNSLVIAVATLGIPLGLTKYVSAWEKDGEWSEIRETIGKLIVLLLFISLFLLILTIIFSKRISVLILDSESYSLFLIISALAFPFSSLSSIFDSYIRGLKRFNEFVKLSVLTSGLSLLISIPCILLWGVIGVPIFMLSSAIMSVLVFTVFFVRRKLFSLKDLKLSLFPISGSLKSILKIGIAGLIDMVLLQLTQLYIRSSIIQYLGIESNGIYQTIFAISNNYLSIFIMSLFIYVLPTLSEMKNVSDINKEINNTVRFTLFIIFPIIVLTFSLREFVISLLYTSQFLSASDFLVFQFIGDYIKILSWILGAWFVPRAKLKLWLSLGVVFNLTYLGVFTALINWFFVDLKSVVFAYVLANVAHIVLTIYLSKRINAFRFERDVLKFIMITSSFLIVIFVASSLNMVLGYVIVILVLAIWLKLCVKRDDIFNVMQLLKLDLLFKLRR